MTTDVPRGRIVMFGGFDDIAQVNLDETWEWDGVTWTQRQPTTHPPPLTDHGLSFDLLRARTVLFGGDAGGVPKNETWEWNGVGWRQAVPAQSPTPRASFVQTWDWARGVTVVFSGAGVGRYESDTWTYDGSTWKQAATTGPSPRIYSAMAYDVGRGVAVLFGGTDRRIAAVLGDTWEWDGTTWKQIFTANKPPPRWGHAMSYDISAQRVVLHGGSGASWPLSDTWIYDGVDWVQVQQAVMPSTKWRHALAYDGATRTSLLFDRGALWSFAFGTPASYTAYGTGCSGSAGVPVLSAASGSLPMINAAFSAEVRNVPPASAAVLLFGASNTTWGALALPLALDGIGMPGCLLLTSPEVPAPMTNSAGTARTTILVPNDAGLLGRRFFNQGLVLDPPANPTGLTLSNGGAGIVGK